MTLITLIAQILGDRIGEQAVEDFESLVAKRRA
jgi:hypothetical protein